MKRSTEVGLSMKLTFDLWERHLAATLSWLEATPPEAAFHIRFSPEKKNTEEQRCRF
jgi:hypothetical protein